MTVTCMSKEIRKEDCYALQEAVLVRLQSINDPQLSVAKLCGGTALSRCWLGHRVSFDLDFFLPEGFKAGKLAVNLKKSGIDFRTLDLVDDLKKANQLHGTISREGSLLKVSFVEDAYFTLFPPVEKPFGSGLFRTEAIPDLYHRKLRTVAGHNSEGDSFAGGRQTARDVFDPYVLCQTFMPLMHGYIVAALSLDDAFVRPKQALQLCLTERQLISPPGSNHGSPEDLASTAEIDPRLGRKAAPIRRLPAGCL